MTPEKIIEQLRLLSEEYVRSTSGQVKCEILAKTNILHKQLSGWLDEGGFRRQMFSGNLAEQDESCSEELEPKVPINKINRTDYVQITGERK